MYKIGILIPVISNGRNWSNIKESYLYIYTIRSFLATYDKEHEYIFYIGTDKDDKIYNTEESIAFFKRLMSVMKNVSIQFHTLPETIRRGHLTCMWNVLFNISYDDNCDYYYQCGDDIDFTTKGWVNACIEKLRNNNNIGMTGPINNNSRILTQSFVSSEHYKIFGYYFPEEIINWYCDDWINIVYNSNKQFYPLRDYISLNKGGKERYNIEHNVSYYNEIISRDVEKLKNYNKVKKVKHITEK